MESELLKEMKIKNGVLDKELTIPIGEHYIKGGRFRYNKKRGGIGGNTSETMILTSVGSEFPVDVVVHPRIKNPALAERAKQMYGSLPFIVPGLHEEAAADLMATATPELKAPNSTVVKLYLDVPMMQRSKQYYLNKIQVFFQHCKHQVGMHRQVHSYILYMHCIHDDKLVLLIICTPPLLYPQL